MKLTINYKTRASKVLGFSPEQIEEYARRVKGHLTKCLFEKNYLTVNMIIQSVFIIQDIRDKQLEQKIKEHSIHNPTLRKYQQEIRDLSSMGLGSTRISKELRTKYKAHLSPSTIYRFLKGEREDG